MEVPHREGQLAQVHRLHKVDVGPVLQALKAVIQGAPGREHDDAHGGAPHGPQPPGDGQAILAGQADVEHHHRGAVVEQHRVQGGAIRHAPGINAEVGQARQ